MPVTITINDNNPQALSLINYLKTLDFVKVKAAKKVEHIQEQKCSNELEAFEKRMRNNLKQIELLKKGKLKTEPLDKLLNSL